MDQVEANTKLEEMEDKVAQETTNNELEVVKKDETAQDPTDEVNDEEDVVTLDEVIAEESELAEAADAVLGDSSDANCSYPMGYIRQALYACMTCTPPSDESSKQAGVCLACSYSCHADHELVELYTKRHFRCDCGNKKFPNALECQLVPDKAPVNDQNRYSHNFDGKYCTCERPFPDPERTTPEVMVQCVVCEDWLHQEHLDENSETTTLPEDCDEFVCQSCIKAHPFLLTYHLTSDTPKENADGCILEQKQTELDKSQAAQEPKPIFCQKQWRDEFCNCNKCVTLFEKHHIDFLLDPEDSIHVYEARAKAQNRESAEQRAEQAFQSTLSHEQQVEMAIGYNDMKTKLQAYLSDFANSKKTVRAEDITSFFDELKASKRQKREE